MKTSKLTLAAKIAVAAFVLASAGTSMIGAGSAYASPYGTNITINDGVDGNNLGTGIDKSTTKEDNETEPGMVLSQLWDLEGFFLNAKKISVVGGYNFYKGQEGMDPGDVFIDINGDAVYSPNFLSDKNTNYKTGYQVLNNLFQYDYVLHITKTDGKNFDDKTGTWASGKYDIIKLNSASQLENTEYGLAYNIPSNPWRYLSGGEKIATGLDIINYGESSQGNTGFAASDNHFVATFDISAIGADLNNNLLFHTTMECGNDNLMGYAPAPVPEPGTMMLLGFGMLGLAVYGKRRMNKEV